MFERLDILASGPRRPSRELTTGFFNTGQRLRDLSGRGDQPLDVVVYGRPVTFNSGTPPTASFNAGVALAAARSREVGGVEALRQAEGEATQDNARISGPPGARLARLQPVQAPVNFEALVRNGATLLPNDPFGVSLRAHLRRIVKDA